MVKYMNWYKKTKSSLTKSAISNKGINKSAAEITKDFDYISPERWEEFIYITATRTHETSYYVQITCREFDNKKRDPFWITVITAFSFESGNIVYKKCIYHKKKSDAKNDFNKALKVITELRQEQEANNLPTASIPTMIWHALHDIDGDTDLKPKANGNIVYLRQNHNVNENKGNLFKNILYLDKADNSILEKSEKSNFHSQEGMF